MTTTKGIEISTTRQYSKILFLVIFMMNQATINLNASLRRQEAMGNKPNDAAQGTSVIILNGDGHCQY
jgi:hypothetical protein